MENIDLSEDTLGQIFEAQVLRTTNAIAIMDEHRALSYQELDKTTNQLARLIRQFNIQSDSLVGLFLERSIETVIAILAVLKAGGAYLPIDPNTPAERIKYIFKETNCGLILTQSHLKNTLSAYYHKELIDLNTYIWRDENSSSLENIIQNTDLAYVIYTSGTTGKPKGVAIPHAGVVNRLKWMQKTYPLNSDDVVLQKTPYSFDVSVWEFLWPHQVGASLFIAKPDGHRDPNYLLECIAKNHISVMHFVPSMLSAFCRIQEPIPESLRYVFCSGEALRASQVSMFYNLCKHPIELHNLYGPTEASIDATYFSCPPGTQKVMIGKAIDNMQTHILNEGMCNVPQGEIGELYLSGIGLARGYYQQEKLTAEHFIYHQGKRLYKTGDLVKMDNHGDIEYLGRNDFQVKIRGFRIELGDIEHVLSSFPSIRQTAVLTQIHHDEPYLIAYYESDETIPSSDLSDYLKKQVPDYMQPLTFIHLKAFPVNSNGKLCRKSLMPFDFSSLSKNLTPATTPIEKILASIWSKELGLKQVGIHDNFFLLGGHSLAAARILTSIKAYFGKKIELIDFYQAANISNLALHLRFFEKKPSYREEPIQSNTKKLPLTDFQLLLWLSAMFEPEAKKINIVSRKRLKGHLNFIKLNKALNMVVTEQGALNYHLSPILPYQLERQKNPLSIEFESRELCDPILEKNNSELAKSMNELIAHSNWSKNKPLLKARLFRLPNQEVEIHLCMPHLICDETSMRILWEKLSDFYLTKNHPSSENNTLFKNYILEEDIEHNMEFEKKLDFWKHYIQDASLFKFPESSIVHQMREKKLAYSSYFEISDTLIDKIKNYGKQNQINLNAILTGALALTLSEYCQFNEQGKKFPLINLIKSTRENIQYDKTIGCMIRVEPFKICINKKQSFLSLCQNIQFDTGKLADMQRFSSLLKFAFHTNCFKFKKLLHRASYRIGMPIYTQLIKLSKIPYKNFKPFHYCWRLAAFERENIFLINLNIWNNFAYQNADFNQAPFGLTHLRFDMIPFDLTLIDDLLDVCFMRDHSNHKAYLVLSGNLTHDFKKSLFNQITQVFKSLEEKGPLSIQ